MDSNGQLRLNYTEDFSVACRINNLKREDVLQYFINRISFYAYNGGETDAASLLATNILLECMEEKETVPEPLKDKKVRELFLKHMALLSKLNGNPHLTLVEKMQESLYLMEEWSVEMLPLVNYETSAIMEEGHMLILTFDFNLVCRMSGLTIAEALQYFIDNISLAVERAVNLSGFVKSTSCMVLFQMMLVSRRRKHKLFVQLEGDNIYTAQLEKLDERLRLENDLEQRISAYRSFYLEWAQNI